MPRLSGETPEFDRAVKPLTCSSYTMASCVWRGRGSPPQSNDVRSAGKTPNGVRPAVEPGSVQASRS